MNHLENNINNVYYQKVNNENKEGLGKHIIKSDSLKKSSSGETNVNPNLINQAKKSVKSNLNSPSNPPKIDKTPEKAHFPEFNKISTYLDLGKNELNNEAMDKALQSIHQSRVPTKAEIAYGLIESNANKLEKLTEHSQQIRDLAEAKKYFSEKMIAMGYKPVSISIKENGQTEELNLWSKPDSNFMVHTTPFGLVNSKIAKPFAFKELRDENFILNNNPKLCVSVFNSSDGQMFQPAKRAGLIMKVPPQSILDTYSSDRLSPTGFRRSQEEVNNMSKAEREIYEDDLARVDKFMNLLKQYHGLCSYAKNLGEGITQVILTENVNLKDAEREKLINFLAGLDSFTKASILNPKDKTFEENPALLLYLNQLEDIFTKYGKHLEPEMRKVIFQNESVNVGKQLSELASFSRNLLKETESWKGTNIHRLAGNWEEAIRDGGETFAARLMPSGLHGPSSLAHVGENDPNRFVELNVVTKNVDIAGFLIDKMHMQNLDGSRMTTLDREQTKELIEKFVDPLMTKIKDLESAKANLVKNSPEYTKIANEIKNLQKEMSQYDKIVQRDEFIKLVRFASSHFIPVIISSEN